MKCRHCGKNIILVKTAGSYHWTHGSTAFCEGVIEIAEPYKFTDYFENILKPIL